MSDFPDLSRVGGLLFPDTETTGLTYNDRPVGFSVAWPDEHGQMKYENSVYLRWGHELGGNNCTLEEFKRWAAVELARKDQTKVFHNAAFDMRMLAYHNIAGIGDDPWAIGRVEDTGFLSALNNENERSHSLDALDKKYGSKEGKEEAELVEWLYNQFGGYKSARAQKKNLWRAPGNIVEEYARYDAVRTGATYFGLKPLAFKQGLEEVFDIECDLVPILLKMHLLGVPIDVQAAHELQSQFRTELGKLEMEWDVRTGGTNPNSGAQLATLFDHEGISYPLTEKGNPSFTADYLETVKHHWVPGTMLRMRRLYKYAGTFVESYILDRVDDNGFLHGEFNQVRTDHYGTVSGRFSSSSPNLQNIPSPGRDPVEAAKIRGLFVPLPGAEWFKADWSQIEFRFLAHYCAGLADFADDEEEAETYRALSRRYNDDPGVDFHQMVADLVEQERYEAKHQNFGLVYGMGEKTLAKKLGLSLADAREKFDQYHSRMPAIKKLYKKTMARANKRGRIKTWKGRVRHFKKGRRGHDRTHSALNALLQGSAADLMKVAMVEACGPSGPVDWEHLSAHLTVHDELDGSVMPGKEGAERMRALVDIMEDRRGLSVPIKADPDFGRDWGHVKGVEDWEKKLKKGALS
jgi:DNA polymerase-1